jgi:cytochrome b involved in lipid metabolism
MPHEAFEDKMKQLKKKYNVQNDVDLTTDQLKELVQLFKEVYKVRHQEDCCLITLSVLYYKFW